MGVCGREREREWEKRERWRGCEAVFSLLTSMSRMLVSKFHAPKVFNYYVHDANAYDDDDDDNVSTLSFSTTSLKQARRRELTF